MLSILTGTSTQLVEIHLQVVEIHINSKERRGKEYGIF